MEAVRSGTTPLARNRDRGGALRAPAEVQQAVDRARELEVLKNPFLAASSIRLRTDLISPSGNEDNQFSGENGYSARFGTSVNSGPRKYVDVLNDPVALRRASDSSSSRK